MSFFSLPVGDLEPKHYLGLLKKGGFVFENPVHIITVAIVRLAMDPNQEVSRPARDLFDAVFKENKRKNSENPDEIFLLHTKKSPYFKYASKYWLRTLLYENVANKELSVQRQVKIDVLENSDLGGLRSRTRSKPRNRAQREKEEKLERDVARNYNMKIYKRCCDMYNKPVDNMKRLVHYHPEITEQINDMMFLPYSNALIAAGETGLYLIDLGNDMSRHTVIKGVV